ncbi:MAG: polyribonucleotide nucleotidyltransferase [Firmicutes bacterium]|nr:polyribonucleotide nucleotidyltransferase [Bacillota bacterium]
MDTFKLDLQGRELLLQTGKLAKQAGGSVLVRYGDTVILVTATVSDQPREDADFFPLTVDYEERLYAVGRIPGGFIKREGRPTEKAILAARLTDRPLRPLFPQKFRNSVHIVTTVLSVDQDCPPETLSIIGASTALSISRIPFDGPVGAVVVGMVDDMPVINPTVEQMEKSIINLIVAGTADAIMMIESSAAEISEERLLTCIEAGHEQIKRIVDLQEKIVDLKAVPKMEVPTVEELPQGVEGEIGQALSRKIRAAFDVHEKLEREKQLEHVKESFHEQYNELYPDHEAAIKDLFESSMKETLRTMILKENIRPDGRKANQIREISCEAGVLPRTHGSALFTRGQTQVLNVCTLGALRDMQILDGLGIEESKRFIHHYNFPPFSVGEAGFIRGPGRREIGHGSLAERALETAIPNEDDFPYTIRLVSEVLESNGSSSMASVCAASMALMDAGVKIKKAVAGIAMGMIKEDGNHIILSDIQGIEDFLGDMDFKIAGTRDGITTMQMDIKIKGLSREIMAEAISKAREGYLYIMDIMDETISRPNDDLSPYAPRIITLQIDVDKIRDVIGPGGRMINKIIADTGVGIDIESDGKVYISAVDKDAGQKALDIIESLVKEVEPGEKYLGKVTRVEKYGAFVEILPGKEGLVHISQLDFMRVERTEDILNLGDEVLVKVIGIDERGRIDLSRKEAMERPANLKRPFEKNRDRDRKKPFRPRGKR